MDSLAKIRGRILDVIDIQLIRIVTRTIVVHDGEMQVNPNTPCGVIIIINGATE